MKNRFGKALILHGMNITHPDRIVYEEGCITRARPPGTIQPSRRFSCATSPATPVVS
ncbi:MAG: hypothetical protein LZF60_130032 [Nitrospira sp.]|nr:MAG: hypothetical protein LZF60_130032 [Nitrospira sp.]